jgi:hypothetical protein
MSDKIRSLQHTSIELMAKKLAELLEDEGEETPQADHATYRNLVEKFVQDWRTSNTLPEIILFQQSLNKGLRFKSPIDLEAMFESVPRLGTKVSKIDEALRADEGPMFLVMASYLATQDFMKKNYAGETVRAYRGFQWDAEDNLPEWAQNTAEFDFDDLDSILSDPKSIESTVSSLREKGASVTLRTTPLASYTLNPSLAIKFAFEDLEKGEVGTFVEATIPRNLVVSIPGVGLGEPALEEVVAFDADMPASAVSVVGT